MYADAPDDDEDDAPTEPPPRVPWGAFPLCPKCRHPGRHWTTVRLRGVGGQRILDAKCDACGHVAALRARDVVARLITESPWLSPPPTDPMPIYLPPPVDVTQPTTPQPDIPPLRKAYSRKDQRKRYVPKEPPKPADPS